MEDILDCEAEAGGGTSARVGGGQSRRGDDVSKSSSGQGHVQLLMLAWLTIVGDGTLHEGCKASEHHRLRAENELNS